MTTGFTVPGQNTLRQAQSIQGTNPINYYRATGRQNNTIGNFIDTYAPPVLLRGSVQPIQRSLYEQMGLQFQKNYVNLYVTQYMQDITRATQGDVFSWNGRLWKVESNVNWAAPDGWIGTLAVDSGADPAAYLTLGFYQDPGVTDVSTVLLSNQNPKSLLVVDVPIWTIGDAFYKPVIFGNTLVDGQTINVNVAIGGVQQGNLTVTASGGQAFDYPSHYPGLSSYGVVAGGLRKQSNVRLTISSAVVISTDVTLSRGVA